MTSESTHFSNQGGMPSVMSAFENGTFANQNANLDQQEKNLMKYLSPVKHLYRVAYADPTEHIKRV